MAFPERVTTERLVLQRWVAGAHTDALAALNAQPEAVRFLNAGVPYTREESARQSGRFAEHWDTYGFGLWAVEADGRIVGFTGVCHPRWFADYAHELEVAWRLDPGAWGRGYATEAGRAALAAAWEHLPFDRVLALIDDGNDASVAVACRLDMQLDHRVADPHGSGERLMVYAQHRPASV